MLSLEVNYIKKCNSIIVETRKNELIMASNVNFHSLIEPSLIYIRLIYIKILEKAFRNNFIPAITGESAVSDIFRQLTGA